MKESVAIAKEADTMSSPTKSDKIIHHVRNESEKQFGSLRGVIDNIRRDGGTPSVESIATELSSMRTVQRVPVLMALQRTHGNRYVQRVVIGIQAKLKVGQPGDIYEQEADRMADAVMLMPEPEVQREPEGEEEKLPPQVKIITPIPALTLQRQDHEEEEELKKKKKEEEEEETLQAKELLSHLPEVTPEFESHIHALKGGGQPLPESMRTFFEPRFGYDFSQVRVHTDAQAAESARTLSARALTVGHDVVFGAGQYAPETTAGQRLLAHELTHVVQQKGDMSYGKHTVNQSRAKYLPEVDEVARSVTQLEQQATSKQNTGVDFQEISTNEITSKSNVFIHLQSIGKTTNHDPSLYRKKIHEFQQENSAEKISASQKQILESPKSMNIRQKDSSQTLRRCVGCNTPSTTTQSFTRGQTLAVSSGNSEGWIRGRLGTSASGTVTSFPDFLKVNYLELRGGRDYFEIMEGPHNSQTASLLPGHLASGINWEGPASVRFVEDSSRSTPYQSRGQLDYGAGTAEAKIFVSPPRQKIAINSDYPLRLPDFPHPGGASYGDYAKTWFRLVDGPQGDEYLHRGRFSAGCVTVTSDDWPAIYQHLIKKRQGRQHIGTIRRIIP